ncbi:MAG: polysaccharide deacetylase family protein [Polyangiaceae bacterium]
MKWLCLLALTFGCAGSKSSSEMPASGGNGGAGGAANVGGATSASGVPNPPGPSNVPVPTGTSANLHVLPWAGFKAAVSYTFDDSQPSQIQHWPELSATGVRMTFYINSINNWIPNYDASFKEAIAQGHEIGNHTAHHCHPEQLNGADLVNCKAGLPTVEEEIDSCSDYIKSPLGQKDVWTFAYPFGDLGYTAAAKTRFMLARGVFTGTISPTGTVDPFNLPIIGHTGSPTVAGGDDVSLFNADIDTAASRGDWVIFLYHSVLPTPDDWYAGESIATVTGSIEYARGLSGGVWLDSVVNIGAYWLGARLLTAATPTVAGSESTWTWTLPDHFPPGRIVRVSVDGGALSQGGQRLTWDPHGFYEVSLDAGSLTWAP